MNKNLIIGLVSAIVIYIISLFFRESSRIWFAIPVFLISFYFIFASFEKSSIIKGILTGLIVGVILMFLFIFMNQITQSGKLECLTGPGGSNLCPLPEAILSGLGWGLFFIIPSTIFGLIIGLIIYLIKGK